MDTYLKCPNCGKEDFMNKFPMRWVDYKDTPSEGITTYFKTNYCPDCFFDISFLDCSTKPTLYPGGSQAHYVKYLDDKLSWWQRLLNTIKKWLRIKTKEQRLYEEWFPKPTHPIKDGKFLGIIGQLKEQFKK